MPRPIFGQWPHVLSLLIGWLMFGALTYFIATNWFLIATISFVLISSFLSERWVLRFFWHVRTFRTVTQGRIILHYAPQLSAKRNMPILLNMIQEELDVLTLLFGRPLRRRVKVYLFERCEHFDRVFGGQSGGRASIVSHSILIADDTNVQETIRHELGHLYAALWNMWAPPLLAEGMCVWLQESFSGLNADTWARPIVAAGGPKISLLAKRKYFYTNPLRWKNYVVAGSFVGFLIRTYGWRRYRKLYKSCDGFRFGRKFQAIMGVSLEEAETKWRRRLVRNAV